ncbi:hypothetical protein YC2023_111977 [Brassica napus]
MLPTFFTFSRLTSKDGKLALERTKHEVEKQEISPLMQVMPLYLNSRILRALQESLATELASSMSVMCNALELERNLTVAYNRELLEIVAGAEGVS